MKTSVFFRYDVLIPARLLCKFSESFARMKTAGTVTLNRHWLLFSMWWVFSE